MTVHAARPAEAAADWTIAQGWDRYTTAEHDTWNTLFARQMALLLGRVVPQFLSGVAALGMDEPGIPDFARLSERLTARTGWQVVAVPGLVPDAVFFEHLANRRFVAGSFIRRPDQIDYLEEPDVFHDVFGHVPLLADPVYADYMQAYGRGGLRAERLGGLAMLARLYWYTVEFGLVRSPEGMRIYGAGIVSSASETRFALESQSPNRIGFAMQRVMRTGYRIDDFQQTYFVIDSFDHLLHETVETDFAPLYAAHAAEPPFAPGSVLPGDLVLWQGTQDHEQSRPPRS